MRLLNKILKVDNLRSGSGPVVKLRIDKIRPFQSVGGEKKLCETQDDEPQTAEPQTPVEFSFDSPWSEDVAG